MLSVVPQLALPLALSTGVAAHLLLFIRGQWHLKAPAVVIAHTAAVAVAPVVWAALDKHVSWLQAYATTVAMFVMYLIGLYGSMTVYRLFFHRISHFPGPKGAAISKIWHAWKCRDSQNHLVLDKLYHKYGPFVRTGPAEITIFHVESWEILDGNVQNNTRTDWYDLVHPRVSPIFSRTNEDHRMRRDQWNYALSSKNMKDYLPSIREHIDKLQTVFRGFDSKPFNFNEVAQMFVFDTMGLFAYDEHFDQTTKQEFIQAAVDQRSALSILGPLTPLPWVIYLAFCFTPQTWKVRDWNSMAAFCEDTMKKQITKEKTKKSRPSVASWLVEEYKSGLTPQNAEDKMNLLCGNSLALTIGASDTSQSSLTAVFYHLAMFPEHQDKLRQEVAGKDLNNSDLLASLPHLNAVINESMRLLPAAMTFGTRETPPEGLWIDDTFIPGNVKITTSRWTVCRMPEVYPRPCEFIPERWTTQPELIKDNRAFAPFGSGKRACVGKNLALTQMRMLISTTLLNFKVAFAPGTDVESIEDNLLDQMTGQLGPFKLVFTPLADVSEKKAALV